MQTKSEMINRIAELARENAELKQEVKQWKYEYEMLDACLELEQGKMSELKAENERLKNCLQEIKRVAETCNSKINCEECPFTDECNTEMEALGVCRMILKLINKTEEE